MSIAKDRAIRKILNEFEKASNLTLKQLDLLKKIINTKIEGIPAETLQQMKKNEKKLDWFELKISERITNSIVLYSPMASELRNIMACFRMITNLERIGDLVIKTMSTLKKMEDTRLLKMNLEDINKMVDIATEMLHKATFSFIDGKKEDAEWAINNDDAVNVLNKHIARNSILAEEVLQEVQKIIVDYSSIKSIISSIERIADHATHIGEASIFALEGKDVRHKG
ncbi:MAG: phosphate uptake regulator PhoU [Bacteroidales bacterium]|nr:phosphate uptake regulator PhoU [Bacteroidales bacterium]